MSNYGTASTGASMGTQANLSSMGSTPFAKLTKHAPEWQMLYKVIVFLVLWGVFAIVYAIIWNDDEWSHPSDEEGNSIKNPPYMSAVITGTIGYGDYYPYSPRAIVAVIIHILFTWITFTLFLS